jgi:type II secretory pathway predicted ATPase ExeA
LETTPEPVAEPDRGLREALAELLFGVWSRKRVMVMTGKAGAGKTAVLTSLGDQLKREGTEFAFLLVAPVDVAELYEMLAYDLELPCSGRSKVETLMALRARASGQSARGSTTVLMFDEAHLLSEEVLREVEALEGAVQVILAGRPELEETLEKGRLRGLRMQVGRWMRLGGGADGEGEPA